MAFSNFSAAATTARFSGAGSTLAAAPPSYLDRAGGFAASSAVFIVGAATALAARLWTARAQQQSAAEFQRRYDAWVQMSRERTGGY